MVRKLTISLIFLMSGIGLFGQGGTLFYDGTGIISSYVRPLLMTTTATINTTISNTIDVTYTWGTANAANTVTCTNATIEILN